LRRLRAFKRRANIKNAQAGRPPFHAALGRSQPWARGTASLDDGDPQKGWANSRPVEHCWRQAGPLAIPLRQAEMRIRDKTSVDKASRAIYSSLTIDDHSLDRFGRT
jgi:hypothetical protein